VRSRRDLEIHARSMPPGSRSLPRTPVRYMFSGMEVAYQASFDELSTPLYDVTFCVFDIETTGGSPVDCSITEIGAVKYKGGEEVGTFQTLRSEEHTSELQSREN